MGWVIMLVHYSPQWDLSIYEVFELITEIFLSCAPDKNKVWKKQQRAIIKKNEGKSYYSCVLHVHCLIYPGIEFNVDNWNISWVMLWRKIKITKK